MEHIDELDRCEWDDCPEPWFGHVTLSWAKTLKREAEDYWLCMTHLDQVKESLVAHHHPRFEEPEPPA